MLVQLPIVFPIAGFSVPPFPVDDSVPSWRPFGASPLYSSIKANTSWFFSRLSSMSLTTPDPLPLSAGRRGSPPPADKIDQRKRCLHGNGRDFPGPIWFRVPNSLPDAIICLVFVGLEGNST